MYKDYYEMLVFIRDCPDDAISKEIMFNALKWSYPKIDYVISDLLKDDYIEIFNYWNEDFDRYKITYKGRVFINDYESTKIEKSKSTTQRTQEQSLKKLSWTTIIDLMLRIIGK